MSAEAASTEAAEAPSALRRVARVGKAIVAIHVEVASREVARDRKRLGSGVVLMVGGVILLTLLLAMLDVAAACALHEQLGRGWAVSTLSVAGADLLMGLLLFAVGRRRLRGPLLPETRATLRRTLDAVWED